MADYKGMKYNFFLTTDNITRSIFRISTHSIGNPGELFIDPELKKTVDHKWLFQQPTFIGWNQIILIDYQDIMNLQNDPTRTS